MSTGTTLLELQDADLALMRDRETLEQMPEVKELARKRKLYLKLKSEATQLYARKKDVQTDLSDLDEAELAAEQDIHDVQRSTDKSDYRSVQELEVQLSLIAKRQDKIAFARKEREGELADIEAKAAKLAAYIHEFEQTVKDETREAREHAAAIKKGVEETERTRARLIASLDPEVLERYDAASKRFRGLAVERLEGDVPSICRTALQPAALGDLRRTGEVGECPYCHRILVSPVVE